MICCLLLAILGITSIPIGWLWYRSVAPRRGGLPVSQRNPENHVDQPLPGPYSHVSSDLASAGWLRRPVYPYSVIPGGVRSVAEFRQVLLRDPVAAGHYARFDVARSRILELQVERMAYVSYRMKNRIFWTSRKIRLLRGERVVTDGVNYARARCGNRISEVSQSPTSPQQPPEAEMETALVFPNQTLIPVAFILPGGTTETAEPASPAAVAGAPPSETAWFVPPPFGLPYGGSPPGKKPQGSPYPLPYRGSSSKPSHPSPTVVPEPRTVLLISAGLGFVAFLGKRRNREK